MAQSVNAPGTGAGNKNIEKYKAEQNGSFAPIKDGEEENAFGCHMAHEVRSGCKPRRNKGGNACKQTNYQQGSADDFDKTGNTHKRRDLQVFDGSAGEAKVFRGAMQ